MRLFSALSLVSAAHGLTAKNPILEVVKLLEKIQDENTLEETKDVAHMKAWSCHYKDTKEDLSKKMEDNNALIASSKATIESTTSTIKASLTKKEKAKTELQEQTENLKTANKDEVDRMAEFNLRSTELTQAISALKGAITTLQKHQSFLQKEDGMKKFAKTLSKAVSMYRNPIRPSEMESLQAFLQQPTVAKYQSQSGQIFGLLSQMLEDFEQDLGDAKKADEDAKVAHVTLTEGAAERQASLSSEIADLDQAVAEAKALRAENKVTLSQQEELLKLNTKALEELEAQNTEKDNARSLRKNARDDEQDAVAEAIKILTAEEGRKHQQETFGMFLQVSIRPHLALAQKAEGTFQVIIDEIKKRITAIEEEKVNDKAHHDKCVADIAASEKQIALLEIEKQNLEDTISALTAAKEALEERVAANKESMNKNSESVRELSTVRKGENDDYVKALNAHRQTVVVLTDAIKALAVYAPAFIQQPLEGDSQSDAQNAGGAKAISLLKKIRGEVKGQMQAMDADESASQKAYENAVQGLNTLNKALNGENNQLTTEISETEISISNREGELSTATGAHKTETETLNSLNEYCAFILKHLNDKTNHADNEIQAMKSAMQYLESSADALSHSEKQVDDATAASREP